MKVFRFDDICTNSNMGEVKEITELLQNRFKDCYIMWAISPLVHHSEKESQRVFPSIYTARSDHKIFYNVDKLGLIDNFKDVHLASHGLIHCDHRLLSYEVQEMSILTSCSLTNSRIFVPPFNKWNKDTEKICEDNYIELIKFEDNWLSMEHNKYNEHQRKWYLHHWKFGIDKVKEWIG